MVKSTISEETQEHLVAALNAMEKETGGGRPNAFLNIIMWALINVKANSGLSDFEMSMLLGDCLNKTSSALKNDEYEIDNTRG